MNVAARIAAHCVARMDAQRMKGKARDRAAMEFILGAAAAAAVIHGDKSPEWSALSLLAFMVSIRGYAEVVSAAEKPAADVVMGRAS